jgi:CubicO group peptidase (beta-lactamase class C family)
VAAYVVEQVSGENFREYCWEHIFKPLTMYHSSYNYNDLNNDRIAVMYDDGNTPTKYFDNRVYAAGGVKSTLQDLARFAVCMLDLGEAGSVKLLEEQSVRKMLTLQNPTSGRCLIWEVHPGGWYGHTGGLELGTTVAFEIHPETRTAFAIFTSAHSSSVVPGGEIYGLIKQEALKHLQAP